MARKERFETHGGIEWHIIEDDDITECQELPDWSITLTVKGKREMKVCVEVHLSLDAFEDGDKPFREYTMNHNNPTERKVLGMQCRNAFEAGQVIVTYPQSAKDS